MDQCNPNTVRYFDVSNLEIECTFCQALGFKGENKGSLTAPHLVRGAVGKGRLNWRDTRIYLDISYGCSRLMPQSLDTSELTFGISIQVWH